MKNLVCYLRERLAAYPDMDYISLPRGVVNTLLDLGEGRGCETCSAKTFAHVRTLTDENAKLRAENEQLRKAVDNIHELYKDLEELAFARRQERDELQSESAATWQQINNYCLYECGKDRDSCDDCGLSSKATSTTAGAAMLRLVEAVETLRTFDDFRVTHDCRGCWPDGVPNGYAAARREVWEALEDLMEEEPCTE